MIAALILLAKSTKSDSLAMTKSKEDYPSTMNENNGSPILSISLSLGNIRSSTPIFILSTVGSFLPSEEKRNLILDYR